MASTLAPSVVLKRLNKCAEWDACSVCCRITVCELLHDAREEHSGLRPLALPISRQRQRCRVYGALLVYNNMALLTPHFESAALATTHERAPRGKTDPLC